MSSKIIKTETKVGAFSISVVEKFSNMSTFSKFSILGYSGFVIGTFALSAYRDGKKGLLNHREEVRKIRELETERKKPSLPNYDPSVFPITANVIPRKTTFKTEYDAVWYNLNAFNNFWNSLFFPWDWITNIMPYIVIKLNPPPKEDKTD